MKHPIGLIFIPIIVFGLFKFFGPFPLSINSITTNKSSVFTVSGEGSVTAIPDTATINLGITVSKPTVKEAQTEANLTIKKIQEDLKKLGIPEKDVKTINYNLNPSYDWAAGQNKITGYEINTNLMVKVSDLEKINQVIDLAAANGANLVGGLQFTVNDEKMKELQKQAREQAVEQAKQKAQDLAKVSGLKLGKLIDVQESTSPNIRPLYLNSVTTDKTVIREETKVTPGEQEIQISIALSYETL